MPAEIHVFRCLDDNIGALVHDPATGACAAIDAPEEAPILAALAETGWQLTDILVTHRHADHVQAIGPLKRAHRLPGRRARARRATRFRSPTPSSARATRSMWATSQAHVWETPGHCADHVSYWFAADRRSLPATPCSPSAAAGCWKGPTRICGPRSSASRRLPDEARVYCGHDYTLVERPLRARRRSRQRGPEGARRGGRGGQGGGPLPRALHDRPGEGHQPVPARGEPALAQAVHKEGAAAVEVFQALREWKNRF